MSDNVPEVCDSHAQTVNKKSMVEAGLPSYLINREYNEAQAFAEVQDDLTIAMNHLIRAGETLGWIRHNTPGNHEHFLQVCKNYGFNPEIIASAMLQASRYGKLKLSSDPTPHKQIGPGQYSLPETGQIQLFLEDALGDAWKSNRDLASANRVLERAKLKTVTELAEMRNKLANLKIGNETLQSRVNSLVDEQTGRALWTPANADERKLAANGDKLLNRFIAVTDTIVGVLRCQPPVDPLLAGHIQGILSCMQMALAEKSAVVLASMNILDNSVSIDQITAAFENIYENTQDAMNMIIPPDSRSDTPVACHVACPQDNRTDALNASKDKRPSLYKINNRTDEPTNPIIVNIPK